MTEPIKLSQINTTAPIRFKKNATKKKTLEICAKIAEKQRMLVAEQKHSLLIIFQGMDASGKDGATRRIFKHVSPINVHVKSYKKPTEEEMNHDFLWRIHQHAPAKGSIQIFNRSHYEDVLIQRVHKWIDEEQAQFRFKAINLFEELLQKDNNTTILKFYMHISQERQKEKLQERIDLDYKNWKHNSNDWKEAVLWDDYRKAYERVLNTCNVIPWHIVPCDRRWYRDYVIATKILETLEQLDPQYPKIPKEDLIV